MSEYTPTDEGWALVDLLKDILEDAETQPKFTRDEHALMGAGQIRREWLAEHDAQLVEKLAGEFESSTVKVELNGDSLEARWWRGVNQGRAGVIASMRARAAEIREGEK